MSKRETIFAAGSAHSRSGFPPAQPAASISPPTGRAIEGADLDHFAEVANLSPLEREALKTVEFLTEPESSTGIEGAESGYIRKPTRHLKPSPENRELYRDDRDGLREFGEHLEKHGVLEPLVITRDDWIVSGHRRYAAASLVGIELLPCRVLDKDRDDYTADEYIALLREYNRQRSKSLDTLLAEACVDANPEAAYISLVEGRVKRARNGDGEFQIEGKMHRSKISPAKTPMLEAAIAAIESRREFWPLTVRETHYVLLSTPPLRHAKKPESTYTNNLASYKDLCDLLARARIAGRVPWEAITDETRPMKVWPTNRTVGRFVERELSNLFGNYWRDLLQSQSDHYEIIIEKSASLTSVANVAMKYTIPVTSGRGHTCKDRLKKLAGRFHASGKDRLVLFLLSDFDPSGDAISNTNAKSLRDDFGIAENKIVPVRVALRPDQIAKYSLPQSLEAKTTSSTYNAFVDRHGVTYAVELEALEPAMLQAELDKAIRSHLDVDLFNREVETEREEAGKLESLKRKVLTFIRREGLTA